MSSRVCSQCGCSDIDIDPSRGDAVCTGCGSVLDDQIIVSEVQFSENSAGTSSVMGQFVSSDGVKSGISMGSGFHHGVGRESRAITFQKGRKKIQQVADQLRLNSHCVDMAFHFFKRAVNQNLTKGRRSNVVVGACLYIVCRTENTPHMLCDFADVLQVDVWTIGRTYSILAKELYINIPCTDPCHFIQRFAHKLEFGDKTHDVAMTALRLVSRMKRDWMAQGRRPSGLCGAALLVASRVFNFRRTITDIIKVVRIGEDTIRKRLNEFEQTASSQLTIEEFQNIDLEEEADPPCLAQGKEQARLKHLQEELKGEAVDQEITDLQHQIDEEIEQVLAVKFKRYQPLVEHPQTAEDNELDEEFNRCQKFLEEETLKGILNCGILKEDEVTAKLEKDDPESLRPTAASLGITDSIEECLSLKINQPEATVKDEDAENGELDLTGINDEEINTYILTESEVKSKTCIWIRDNETYLREQKEKAERKAQEQAEGTKTKKKYRPRKKAIKTEAGTAREAMEKMLAERKLSSKINYDVLKGLTSAMIPDLNKVKEEKLNLNSDLKNEEDMEVQIKESRKRKFAAPKIPSAQKRSMFGLQDEVKKEDVVIESGPVEYQAAEEEEEEEEEEVEEDQHLSAAKLMGTGVAEDDYGDFEEEY